MITQTTGRDATKTSRPSADPRVVVWRELPQRRLEQDAPPEPWYDRAALYEEPERWDGMA